MKKITQLSFLIVSFMLMSVLSVNAQTWLEPTTEDGITTLSFTSATLPAYVSGKYTVSTSGAAVGECSKGLVKVVKQAEGGTISFNLDGCTSMEIYSKTGGTSARTLELSVKKENLEDFMSPITISTSASKTSCKYEKVEINASEKVTITLTNTSGGEAQIHEITFIQTVSNDTPDLSKTSGSTAQTVKQGAAIENIVYTWNEYANNAVVTWEDGNTPSGINATINSTNGTVTIEGTVADDATVGTYRYTVYATDGTTPSKNLTGTITVLDKSKKTIAFVSTSDDASSFNDPIYAYLSQSYNMVLVKSASGMDFSGSFYDMVIADEGLDGSGDNGNLKAGFDKPFLNLKSFFYNTGRWVWGTADNGGKNNGIITVLEPNHPIYDGITISSCNLTVMAGELPEKTLQGATLSAGYASFAHNLAQVSNAAGDGNVISFHEIATGSILGDITTTNKYIMLAISQTAVNYLNETGLAIVKNACDYLMSEEIFGDESCTKKYTSQEITGFSVNGQTLTWNAIPATAKYKVTLTPATRSTIEDETIENSYTVANDGVYSASIIAVNAAGTESQALSTGSFTVTNTVGIESNNTDKAIASVKYYSTTGVEIDENATGVVIVKTTYKDDSVNTTKSVRK